MKHSLWLHLGALAAAPFLALAAQAATVSVSVHKVSSAKGTVTAVLCDKTTFLGRCAAIQRQPANAGTVVVSFPDVAPGRYAISVYHDENANKKLDRNMFGMPSEGYGFSRDAPIRMGPPSFDDAAFDTGPNGTELAISLRY